MNPDNKKRLMKYLFYVSILFVVLISAQFVYLFLYHDSKESPTIGGVLSEWIVGEIPSLNPLIDENDTNSYIMSLAYRSLMKYNPKTESFEDDIATCDTKNLSYIKCTIKKDQFWSDSSPILANDVKRTFQTLKSWSVNGYAINPRVASILDNVTIESHNNSVQFSSTKKDVNLLNILNQPIVKAYILDKKKDSLSSKFNQFDSIYSWAYEISEISTDDTLGIKKLILKRNPYYNLKDEIYIEKVVFNFFKTNSHLESNLDKLNALYDKTKLIAKTSPRFEDNTIYQNQFTSIFLNSAKIKNKDLRALILSSINRKDIISKLGSDYKEALNPYLNETDIDDYEIKNKNLLSLMKDEGYYKLSELEGKLAWAKKEAKVEKMFKENNPDLVYIVDGVKKKNTYTTDSNILLTGLTNWENPDAVYFDDYRLKGFVKGNTRFYFRVNTAYNNLKEGYNTYKLYFEKNWEKVEKEEIKIFYSSKQATIDSEIKTIKNNIRESIVSNDKEDKEILAETQEKIKKLNKDYFYNTDLERFKLNIYYYANKREYQVIAEWIKKAISKLGIDAELNEIRISDFTKALREWSKEYDLLITGIDLWYFNHNIFPYFHSSQVKSWVNFANIKSPNLDITLENLKSENLSKKNRERLENSALKLIKDEQVIKTLYTPPVYYLVDKKIKNNKQVSYLPKMSERFDMFHGAYISYDRKIASENKWVISFIKFLFDIING